LLPALLPVVEALAAGAGRPCYKELKVLLPAEEAVAT
jgi:hypothetical protein